MDLKIKPDSSGLDRATQRLRVGAANEPLVIAWMARCGGP
jgi:hypothetical protein